MPIDWFTVCAQIINFLILLWLLKRFLYRPILNAVERREHHIASELKNAQEQNLLARKTKEEYEHRLYQWQQESDQRKIILEEELKREKLKLMQETKDSYENLKKTQKEMALREFEALNLELGEKVQKEVLAIVRKVLKELGDQSLEKKIVEHFISKLKGLNQESLKVFKKTLLQNKDEVYFRTAFPIENTQQESISKIINEVFGLELSLRFEIHAGLLAGAELVTPGYKISWNTEDYLQKIEDQLKLSFEVS